MLKIVTVSVNSEYYKLHLLTTHFKEFFEVCLFHFREPNGFILLDTALQNGDLVNLLDIHDF